jgi:hypothetical protein
MDGVGFHRDRCRGSGVLVSLGNIIENPNINLLLLDFVRDFIGLHINGRRGRAPELPAQSIVNGSYLI